MKNKIKIEKLESSITEIFEKYAKVTNEAIEKSAIKIPPPVLEHRGRL